MFTTWNLEILRALCLVLPPFMPSVIGGDALVPLGVSDRTAQQELREIGDG
jgi:hypothetical protein